MHEATKIPKETINNISQGILHRRTDMQNSDNN